MKIPLALVAIVVLLSGCSATPERSATPTKSAAGAALADSSVAQWASVVAEQKAYLADWKAKWDADQCVTAPSGNLTCSIETLTGSLVAQTVSTSLKIPLTPGSTGYIGAVPKEIVTIYNATMTAAANAVTAGKAWADTCKSDSSNGDCLFLTFKFDSAVTTLDTKFAAWAPYL